jgi:hypothetical protein
LAVLKGTTDYDLDPSVTVFKKDADGNVVDTDNIVINVVSRKVGVTESSVTTVTSLPDSTYTISYLIDGKGDEHFLNPG